jgi:hypothetical protein
MFFSESVVLYTKFLALAQILLKARNGRLRTDNFHLIATRHYPNIRVLILEAKDIDIVHTIEGGSIKCVIE